MSQHKTPCKTCPFRRDCTPGELGGSPVETFIGQAFGAFWIPCHEHIDYSDPEWRYQHTANQCAGVAIYRSNCHPAERPPALISLPKNDELVFSSPAEMVAHHERVPLNAAQAVVNLITPEMLHEVELRRAGAEVIQSDSLPIPRT